MDASRIEELAQIMSDHGLTRVCIEDADATVELERMMPAPAMAPVPMPMMPSPVAPMPAVVPAAPAVVTDDEVIEAADEPIDLSCAHVVSAPMVGVFYAAPSPGAEPFVHVGSKVHAGDTLCVIEAMKLMNEVTAEVDGEVIDICVNDGELVEYGCCLMKIN